MRFLLLVTILLCWDPGPAAAQENRQDPPTIICSDSRVPAVSYFCWRYRTLQDAAWNQRAKQPADQGEFTLGFKAGRNKATLKKVTVSLKATLDGVHYEFSFVVHRRKNSPISAAGVAEATTATLNALTERPRK